MLLFDWKEPASWTPVVRAFRRRRATPGQLFAFVASHFDGLAVYHAARPLDVSSYYKSGLQISDYAAMGARARQIFAPASHPDISEAALEAAIAAMSAEINDHQLFVAIDDRGFLVDSGHYLIYGSEFLCGVAAHLTSARSRDFRQLLKQYGRPTLFRLALKISRLSGEVEEELGPYLLSELRRVRRRSRPRTIDFTIALKSTIGPEHVLSHMHPVKIPDPLLAMKLYTFSDQAA